MHYRNTPSSSSSHPPKPPLRFNTHPHQANPTAISLAFSVNFLCLPIPFPFPPPPSPTLFLLFFAGNPLPSTSPSSAIAAKPRFVPVVLGFAKCTFLGVGAFFASLDFVGVGFGALGLIEDVEVEREREVLGLDLEGFLG